MQGYAIQNDIHVYYISSILLFHLTKAVKTGPCLRVEHNPYCVFCRPECDIIDEKKPTFGGQQMGILHLQRMLCSLLLALLSLN